MNRQKTCAVVLAGTLFFGLLGTAADADARRRPKQPTETPVLFTAIQPEDDMAAAIVSIHMTVGTGDLVVQTAAGSLSPTIQTEKTSVTRNQVIVTFPNARLDEAYKPENAALLADFRQALPAVQEVTLSSKGNNVVLTIESNKPVMPKVISNTGSLVTVDLGLPHRAAPKVVDKDLAAKRETEKAERAEKLAAEKAAAADRAAKATTVKSQPTTTAAKPEAKPTAVKPAAKPTAQPIDKITAATPEPKRIVASRSSAPSPLTGIFSINDLLQSPQTDGSLRQIWMDFQSGNAVSVVLNIKSYVDKNPNDKIARYLLAVAALSSPDPADKILGEKELKTVISQDPQFSLALLEWIQLRHQNAPRNGPIPEAQYKEISTLLQKVETQFPNAPALKYGRAMLEESKNNTEPMRAIVMAKLSTEPTNAALYEQLGDLDVINRKPQQAGANYVRALSLDPDNSNVLSKLADVYQQTVSDQKAMQYYAQAMSPESLLRYAKLLQTANRPNDAMLLLNTAQLSLGSSVERDKTILFGSGKLYWDMKQSQLALKNLKRFVELSQPAKPTRGQVVEKPMPDKRLAEAQKLLDAITSPAQTNSTAQQPSAAQ